MKENQIKSVEDEKDLEMFALDNKFNQRRVLNSKLGEYFNKFHWLRKPHYANYFPEKTINRRKETAYFECTTKPNPLITFNIEETHR